MTDVWTTYGPHKDQLYSAVLADVLDALGHRSSALPWGLRPLKAGWRRPDIPPDQLALLPDLTPKTASARILGVRRPGGRASARAKTVAEPEKKQQRRAQ